MEGVGFIEDYPIAKLYRDVRITTIYEGTSQLQVVGAIGRVIEGMQESSLLNHYLNEKIEKISNSKQKDEIKSYHAELKNLVNIYKEKEREEKDYLAVDIVDYFCVFFSLLVLYLHEKIAADKNHSILETKKRVAQNFRVLTKRIIETAKVQINSNHCNTGFVTSEKYDEVSSKEHVVV